MPLLKGLDMTVEELYQDTKKKFFEKPSSTIYDQYLISNLNRVIRECFESNNMERMFKGLKPLDEVPLVDNNSDELVYEELYTSLIMPLGLAAYFLIDDDLSKYSIYITDYKNELIKHQKFISKERIDAITSNT